MRELLIKLRYLDLLTILMDLLQGISVRCEVFQFRVQFHLEAHSISG
jgi:hypothetical protein